MRLAVDNVTGNISNNVQYQPWDVIIRPDADQFAAVLRTASSDRGWGCIYVAGEPALNSRQTLGEVIRTASYGIDLTEQEAAGGHTISAHVNKSESYLLDRTTAGGYYSQNFDVVPRRAGSFASLEAANKLVNSTLSQNSAIVDQVASGHERDAFVTATFGSPTGIEAYRESPNSSPYIRTTYGVGVFIVNNPNMPGGFQVITAYPRND